MNKFILLSLFFTLGVWGIWFNYTYPDSIDIIQKNWPVTLTMVFGSFIAGATSEGGGAIAFPVFTKVLNISPLDAKVFSLAIQSVGMMAASFTIVVLRVPVEWRIILWASLGGIFGVILGLVFIAPLLMPDLLKMLFTVMVVSFALTLALLTWKQRVYNYSLSIYGWREKLIIVFTGFCGGLMTGLVGNGIDILCFSLMVLLFRLAEKVATPTSVLLMAINSLFGFICTILLMDGFTPVVEQYWLAAIPVVIIGAPLGAYFCTRLNNKTIAIALISLIMIELISSLMIIPLTKHIIMISLLVFCVFSYFYYQMSGNKRYTPKGEEV